MKTSLPHLMHTWKYPERDIRLCSCGLVEEFIAEYGSWQPLPNSQHHLYVPTKPKRETKDQYFMKIAKLVATRATCPRRMVGCVILNKHGHIRATGYNGVPRGHEHCIDIPCGGEKAESGSKLCMATHAEQNALLQCDNVMEIETIYSTTAPCITCAKLIGNTSCKRVVYSDSYSDGSGVDLLLKLGIEVYREVWI